MKYFDRIERNLKGQMSPSEEQAFLEELKNNPEMQEEYQIQKFEHEAMSELSEKHLLREIEGIRAQDNPEKSPLRIQRWIPLSIAALLVMAVGIGYLFGPMSGQDSLNYQQISRQYYSDLAPNFSGQRMIMDDIESDQQMLNYLDKKDKSKMPEVIEYFSASEDVHSLYYLGHAHYVNGDFELSTKHFKAFINESSGRADLKQFSELYLALSYLGADKKALAEEILVSISNHQEHPFQKQAKEILAQLS